MADVENSSSSSAESSTASSDSCSDSGGEMSDDSGPVGGPGVNLSLAEATQQLYSIKSEEPSAAMKPSFLRTSKKSGKRDSGSSSDQVVR